MDFDERKIHIMSKLIESIFTIQERERIGSNQIQSYQDRIDIKIPLICLFGSNEKMPIDHSSYLLAKFLICLIIYADEI